MSTTLERPAARRQDAPIDKRSPSPRNISRNEQRISTWSGAALVALGISRGKLSGLLMTLAGGGLVYRGLTGHCHCYDALGIDTAKHPGATSIPAKQGVHVDKSIMINRDADELYAFWEDVENLPRVMQHLERVDATDDGRSHWVAKGPFGQTVEWDAEIINERDGEMIAWRSLPDSQVDTTGSIHFTQLGHGRGTAVHVSMKYNPPGGRIADALAWLFGADLEHQLHDDLARFKSVMEAGEAPTIAGQSRGR